MPIYLDNSATTRPCEAAVDAMLSCMREDYYNPSALYAPAMRGEQILKDAGSFADASTLSALERIGIKCISGKKHWKLEYGNVRVPIAKTPSDHRASLNTATDLANRCF